MTRINLVPPEELMDAHLFAEYRELGGNPAQFFTIVLPSATWEKMVRHACVQNWARAWMEGARKLPVGKDCMFFGGMWFMTEEFEKGLEE